MVYLQVNKAAMNLRDTLSDYDNEAVSNLNHCNWISYNIEESDRNLVRAAVVGLKC